MSERNIAEKILKLIYSGSKIKTTDIENISKASNVNYFSVCEFLKEHTKKEKGTGDYDMVVLKDGSANFVYKNCWTGEEKRTRKNRRTAIIAAISGALTGLLLPKLINLISQLFCS
jgi:hypothetical protein